ncbi:hypothetical protein P879_10123 [Paragonimus westermani]|uniref:Uncharacterized protein n=1 Tax=Paragonimus westermani TaxID=34504 RepID=A0A8T0DFI9_9TREM|nr:hypothetical protein P879_10123 [Paragonimus westermani]
MIRVVVDDEVLLERMLETGKSSARLLRTQVLSLGGPTDFTVSLEHQERAIFRGHMLQVLHSFTGYVWLDF